MTSLVTASTEYKNLLDTIKQRVRTAQVRAAVSVNRELVLLYWKIGRDILARQADQGWGAKVIEHLSKDLRRSFHDVKGFSTRNLKYMRAFGEAWPEFEFVQQVAAQLPWFHHCVLLDKVKNVDERLFYVQQSIENGWSRNVLVIQIESDLYHRQGKALTNFEATLPEPDSDLAQQTLKDPYCFDFLNLSGKVEERALQQALVKHIRDFLLELGVGFAFVGSQYRLQVSDREFFVDLLFYHIHLQRYVVIELKTTQFEPEYAGKLNFYLAAVDDLLRRPDDEKSIGLLLCKSRDRVIVEYALSDTHKPIGVAGWTFTKDLPEKLTESLPTVEMLEEELNEVSLSRSDDDR